MVPLLGQRQLSMVGSRKVGVGVVRAVEGAAV